MSKFKAALLDDNKEQLQLNQQMLESIGRVAVVSSIARLKSYTDTYSPNIFLVNSSSSFIIGVPVKPR